jgi:hypothetical protein
MVCGGDRACLAAILASACCLAMTLLPDAAPTLVLGNSILNSLESATAEILMTVPSTWDKS